MPHEAHIPHTVLQTPEQQDSCGQATVYNIGSPPTPPAAPLLMLCPSNWLTGLRLQFPRFQSVLAEATALSEESLNPRVKPGFEIGRSPISPVSGNSGEGWFKRRTLTFLFVGSLKQ